MVFCLTDKINQIMTCYADTLFLNAINETDPDSTTKWYYKAALAGHPVAMRIVGRLFFDDGDFKEALNWYLAAADRGDAESMYNLSIIFREGCGIEKNLDEALAWSMRAHAISYDGDSIMDQEEEEYQVERMWQEIDGQQDEY